MARKPEPPKAPPLRYRKKPVVIEAWRYDGADFTYRPQWLSDAIRAGQATFDPYNLVIKTLEGEMTARPGDWIIRGVKGEIYPCKPHIFAETYEPVED
jgi:hypothetical protein